MIHPTRNRSAKRFYFPGAFKISFRLTDNILLSSASCLVTKYVNVVVSELNFPINVANFVLEFHENHFLPDAEFSFFFYKDEIFLCCME